jgi:hypothetical protein
LCFGYERLKSIRGSLNEKTKPQHQIEQAIYKSLKNLMKDIIFDFKPMHLHGVSLKRIYQIIMTAKKAILALNPQINLHFLGYKEFVVVTQ